MQTLDIEMSVLEQIKQSPKLQGMLNNTRLNSETGTLQCPDLQSFAVMGLNEEAGEVAGLACREGYKDIDMPMDRWIEELGDVLWYLTAAALAKGITLETIWNYNKAKLEARYGHV